MKVTLVILAFFGILAAAAPLEPSEFEYSKEHGKEHGKGGKEPGKKPGKEHGQCNTGSSYCCNNVGDAHSKSIGGLLGGLGLGIGSLTGVIGLGCTPLSIIGLGEGVDCSQKPVCCEGVEYNGLVNVGCSSLSL